MNHRRIEVKGRVLRGESSATHRCLSAARCMLQLFLLTLFTAAVPHLGAATVSWTGASGDWNTLTNWSSGALPGAGDTVTISGTNTLTIVVTGNRSVGALVLNNPNAILRLIGNGSVGDTTLTVSNGVVNQGIIELTSTNNTFWSATLNVASGTLTNAVGGVIRSVQGAGGSRYLTGTLDNRGTLEVAYDLTLNGNVINSGTVHLAAVRTLTIPSTTWTHRASAITGTGTLSMGNGSTFVLAEDFTPGTFFLNAPNLTVNGPGRLLGPVAGEFLIRNWTINAGVAVTGDLRVEGNVRFNNAVTIASGKTLRLIGNGSVGDTTLTVSNGVVNQGIIELTSTNNTFWSATLNVASGTLTNAVGGVIRSVQGAGGSRYLTGTLDNRGTLEVAYDLTLNGNVINSGTVNVDSGTLSLGIFIQTAGLIELRGGAVGASSPMQLLGGVLAGTNTISGSVSNSALIRPGISNGAAPGRLLITGTYTQTPGGALDLQLGGLLPGGQHDILAINGTGNLNGALNVSFLGTYVPTAGNEFGVVTATTRSGAFTQFSSPPGEPQLQLLHTNSLVLVRAINGPPAYPDLRVTSLTATAPTLAAGQTLAIAWRDTNAGSGLTPSGWSDRLTISNATARVTLYNSTFLHNPVTDGPLAPGAGSFLRQTTFRLPDGTNGAGTIRVTVQTDTLNQLFEFNDGFNAETNNFAELTVVSASTDYPDLVVTNISGPLSGLPGQSVPVVWTVRNLGPATAAASWGEYIFLSEDAVVGSDNYVGSLTIAEPLAAGASITRTQLVTLPSLGIGAKRFVVTVDPGHSVFELNEANNSGVATQSISVPAALALHLPSAVYEYQASINGTVTRNDPSPNALTVSLVSSVPDRAAVPASVIIAAGQTSAGFTVALTDDGLAIGDLPVRITATAAGHIAVTNTLTLIENETAHLTLQLGAGTVVETGGSNAIAASVTRNAFTNTALTVELSSNRPDQIALPTTIIIPAGALSAFFTLGPIDNTTIDGSREVYVQASGAGFNATSARIEITDNDTVALALAFTESIVAEGGPSPATLGTVSRNPVTTNAIRVSLSASNDALLQYPRSLTIGPGESSATFAVNVGDDELATGAQTALVTATALAANGNPVAGAGVSVLLTVLDNDGPTLQLTLAATTISESGSTIATVTRNTPATNALVVTLASDRPGEATVPATVTIPLNGASATFTVTGVADGSPDGVKPVNLSASASGLNAGLAQLNVTDIDLPDLTPTAISALGTNAQTEGALEISWSVVNGGVAAAAGEWVDRVHLSRSPYLDATAILVSSFTNNGLLAVGATYTRTRTIALPSAPGDYWLLVETDAMNAFTEASERNNNLASAQALAVQPAYRAEVFADITVTNNGAVIPLHGRTFNTVGGSPAPFKAATVRIWVNDVRRVLSVVSDGAGNFSTAFHPLPTEAGLYFIGADHPRVERDSTNDTFSIVGMTVEPRSLDLVLVPNEARLGSFELRNLSREPLSGISVTAVDLPDGVSATASTTNIMAGAGTNLVSFSFSTTLTNAESFECALRVTSAEGAVIEVAVNVQVRPLRPQLVANPGSLVRGMVRGVQSVVSFEVSNLGGSPSGDLQVLLPANTPWMSLASAVSIPSLAPGAKTVVTLRLNPASDQPLVLYQGALAVVGSSAGVNMPFQFRSLSEARGDLLVSVTDELTYFTQAAPRVTNATVIVRDGYTTEIIASGLSDTNGQVLLTNLPEGDYVLEASATKHASYRGRVSIVPGALTEKETFLSKQTVTYRWTVVPAEIADHYKVVLESTFETEVPAPVLVVENPRIVPLLVENEPQQIEFRLRNEGLIALRNVEILVPQNAEYIITPLVDVIDVLPAKSRVVVPATIQRRPGAGHSSCLVSLPISIAAGYAAGANFVQQFRTVDVTPISVAAGVAQGCLSSSGGGTTGPAQNLAEAGCDVVKAFVECARGELTPCQLSVVQNLCRDGTDLAVMVSDSLACVCGLAARPSSGGGGSRSGGSGGGGGGGGGAYSTEITLAPAGGGCEEIAASGPDGVCARVRIRIEQEAVMTRTAFRGTLEMDNDGGTPLAGLQLTLDIRDGDNLPAGSRFVTTGPVLGGQLSSLDGNGVLPAATSGSAVYTFIPTRDAAPDQPKIYRIGGTLRYLDNGLEVVVPLLTAPITVYPEARLVLDYFQQRDVYSDDPFTAEVEPAEPFALGLIVKNIGAGEAFDFRITSAQPQIIENEKGLLIDFKIIGTQVGSEEVTPSLTATLGDIPPAGAKAARWLFESSLQGKFIDYTASFEHIDALGSENLSIIEQVAIHELIHVVRDDRPGADAEPDFLVNDVPDANDLPDTIYFSSGALSAVTVIANAAADAPATATDRVVQLTAIMTSGWNYLTLPDPGAEFRLDHVVRSDGKVLRVGDNIWQTDRSFPNSEIGAVRERLLHLFDHDGTGSYTLFYRVNDSDAPEILSVIGPSENPAIAPVASATVVFSEAIDEGTFTRDDITLVRNGGANLIDNGVSLAPVSDTTWRIDGLSALTGSDGNYVLTVLGAGIRDFGSNAVANPTSVSWAKGVAAPVVVQVGPVSPNPRNATVANVDALFSLPINSATFTSNDLTLTRNGGGNLINASVSIIALTPTSFRIANLAALTGSEGVYALTVNANDVTGTNGAIGLGSLSVTWTNDTTGPVLVALEAIRTNPRNIVVPSLDVTFSELILPASFTRDDVTLTRDGGPNLVTSEIAVTQLGPVTWRVSGINWNSGQPGEYTFTVNAAGVVDLAGNSGAGSQSRTWLMDTQRPPPPVSLMVTPDAGESPTDSLINTSRPVLMGGVSESNVTVRVFDLGVNRELGGIASVGLTFSLPLQLEPGAHQLRVYTVDTAGNVSSNMFLNVFVDLSAPVVGFVPVTPELQAQRVEFVDVTSSEQLDLATFTAADLTLTLNGGSNLINGSVSVSPLTTNSYRISNLGVLNDTAGFYELALEAGTVADRAGNAGSGRVTNRWARSTGNAAPTLSPIENAAIPEGSLFTFVAQAADANAGDTLTFSMTGAPGGASLDPVTGVFAYYPDELAGPRTNHITITVSDNGIPQRASSRSFRLIVRNSLPDFSVTLGSTNVFAGASNTLPLVLISGVSLTNIVLELDIPPDQLERVTLHPAVPDLQTVQLLPLGGSRHELRLGFDPTQIQNGVRRIGELSFGTRSNQPSALVRVPLERPIGRRLNGDVLFRAGTAGGHVVIVRDQPVLVPLSGGILELFGLPGTVYQLESSPNLPGDWTQLMEINFTNTIRQPVPVPAESNIFYRLRQ